MDAKKTLKQIIAEEYTRCAKDPIYFMKKYCMIQHPTRGKINFNLYPFQEKVLSQFPIHRYNIILKSRQTGISTLVAGYSLWKMLFNEDFSVLVIATKQEVAKNLVTKVRVMNQFLPSWLKLISEEDNKLSLRYSNGSQIKATSAASDAGRSEALSLLVIDECAFVDNVEDIWISAQSTLSTGGDAIILSTPNGVGNFFHKTWVGAEDGSNAFNAIRLHWSVHPERNQSWRDEQELLLGAKGASQECVGYDEIVTIKDTAGSIFDIKIGELYVQSESNISNKFGYEILTPHGFKSFVGIDKRNKDEYLTIYLSNSEVINCSLNHIFMSNGNEIMAKNLNIFDVVDAMNGMSVVVNDVVYNEGNIDLYDIIGVSDNNLFIVDGIVSHNCDADFVSSGDTVIDPSILQFYRETYVQPPIEKSGFDGNLWRWEYPNYSKTYIVVADVSRGDGTDSSAAHVIDIESVTQVAEYRGKIETKDFGNFLVGLATEYNNALLVIENANVGWATIQQVIDRAYSNLYYTSKDLKYVDVEANFTNKYRREAKNMVAGFSTTTRTRPLIISKLDQYFREREVVVRSIRTIDELATFIWLNGKAQAMRGYNDDLVMALSIALWIRDTALRLRQEGIDLTKQSLDHISINSQPYVGMWGSQNISEDNWRMDIGNGESEDLTQWI